jgi:hypothetical protein
MTEKIAIACLMLLIVSMPASAATAAGYVPFSCPMTSSSQLHLTTLDGRRLTRELVLYIPEYHSWGAVDSKVWYEYPGEDCSSGECEPATHSRVQILRLSNGWRVPFHHRRTSISGNFEIELRDGKKVTGSFRAKSLNAPKGAVCE